MRLPDFIIGGAPRSGTSWLYQVLDMHPEIHMAKPIKPEPKFFLIDKLYEKGIEYYAKTWFPDSIRSKQVCRHYLLQNQPSANRSFSLLLKSIQNILVKSFSQLSYLSF